MKTPYLVTSILVFACHVPFARGFASLPDRARAPLSLSTLACQQSAFKQGPAILRALQSQEISDAIAVLPAAVSELRATPEASTLYAARAFCVHELVPAAIVSEPQPTPVSVVSMKAIGVNYSYYEPDSRWLSRSNFVDLVALAVNHQDSRWGRQAFLMMTQLGWDAGGCHEGPDQFYTVIERGRAFLQKHPHSEVSNDIRLAMATSYATWWNLSKNPPTGVTTGPIHDYQVGAGNARLQSIDLYKDYLTSAEGDRSHAETAQASIKLLQTNPQGSNTYDFFCADYED